MIEPDVLEDEIHHLVIEISKTDPRIGAIEVGVRWGQTAFLTSTTKSGSTIRLGQHNADADYVSMYFTCSTTLVAEFREQYGDQIDCIGNREIRIPKNARLKDLPIDSIIKRALTYHLK